MATAVPPASGVPRPLREPAVCAVPAEAPKPGGLAPPHLRSGTTNGNGDTCRPLNLAAAFTGEHV